VPVLRRISFALERGQMLGLVGENGAGKSTLMNLLGGNLPPDAGSMRLGSEACAPCPRCDCRRHHLNSPGAEPFPNLARRSARDEPAGELSAARDHAYPLVTSAVIFFAVLLDTARYCSHKSAPRIPATPDPT
jgi:ATPase subunit of ABC transporter with duplicated ATPase domains